MKIVVGVSQTEALQTVASLISSLKIENAQIEVAHVIERLAQVGVYAKDESRNDFFARYLKMQEEEGEKTLLNAKNDFEQRGLDVQTSLLSGFAANSLIEHAEKTGARLLALGSSGKGPLEGIIVGSTGRKTVIHSPCSVLIAKTPISHGGRLKVVLATDLSEYAGRCIEAFLSYEMKGIAEIVLTTVVPNQARFSSDEAQKESGRWLRTELTSCLKEVGTNLEATKATVRPRIESGPVGDALERVMIEEKADLLIVGAQGHGFLHRLSIGSVSLEQAVRKPYSVLVIRA